MLRGILAKEAFSSNKLLMRLPHVNNLNEKGLLLVEIVILCIFSGNECETLLEMS